MSGRDTFRLGPKRPAALLVTVAIAGWLGAGMGSASDTRTVEVRGTVTDGSGAPVQGHVVRLLKSRTIVRLAGFTTSDQNVEEMRATTDEHGFFEFGFPVDPQFRYYYLRFYDPKIFDSVRYRLPEDLEISKRVRQGRPVQATVVLAFQPDWPKVKALIDRYGAGSACGQVLRALGLPSRREPLAGGRERWEYDTARVAYVVDGGKVLETHALSGPGSPTAGQGAENGVEPAIRVEEP